MKEPRFETATANQPTYHCVTCGRPVQCPTIIVSARGELILCPVCAWEPAQRKQPS